MGTHLTPELLACRIVRHTRAAFGQSISPHLFRDVAATSIAVDSPKHIGDASWFSAMLRLQKRPKSTTIMRGAWSLGIVMPEVSRVYAKASRPTGIAKGDLHARGHLRPLFVRAAARGLDRRSDPALQGKNAREGCECSLVLAKSPATRAGE